MEDVPQLAVQDLKTTYPEEKEEEKSKKKKKKKEKNKKKKEKKNNNINTAHIATIEYHILHVIYHMNGTQLSDVRHLKPWFQYQALCEGPAVR